MVRIYKNRKKRKISKKKIEKSEKRENPKRITLSWSSTVLSSITKACTSRNQFWYASLFGRRMCV